MKTFIAALALASFTLVGCADEAADTTDVDVMTEPAEVTTPPVDDTMMMDSTMTDTTGVDAMMEGEMMADSTSM